MPWSCLNRRYRIASARSCWGRRSASVLRVTRAAVQGCITMPSPGGEQGQVGEPVHVSAQRRQVRLITGGGATVTSGGGGEGEGQVVQAHRGAADRDLVQHRAPGWG